MSLTAVTNTGITGSNAFSPVLSRSLGLIGDSRTVQSYAVNATGTIFPDQGFLGWGFAFAGVYVPIVVNSSATGRKVAAMIAALSEIDAVNPTDVTILGFVNSISDYATTTDAEIAIAYAAITASLQTLYDYNVQRGRFCHIISDTANSSLTTNEKKLLPAVNRWIQEYCLSRPESTYFYDFYTPTVDPTSTVGNFAPLFCNADNIHLSTRGAYACGKAMIAGLRSRFKSIWLPASLSDDRNINAQSKQLLKNPTLQGTGGSASTGCSGTVPTGWAVTSTNGGDSNVLSIVPASDGFGNAMRLAISTLGVSRVSFKSDNIITMFTPGTQLYAVARVKFVNVGLIKDVSVSFKIDSGSKVSSACYDTGKGLGPLVTGDQFTLITPIVMPVAPASLRAEFYVEIQALDVAGILEVERLGLIQV